MNHLNQQTLLDYYYGESDSPAAIDEHLHECAECAREFNALRSDLAAIPVLSAPVRGEDYGQQVWQSIRTSLPVYEAPQKKHPFGWLMSSPWKGFVAAATACLLIVAAFFVGRHWEHRTPSLAANHSTSEQGRERVLLVVLGDHLDRSERLLVELRHADPSTEAPLQAEARDLLSSNRLYRESVKQSGDPTLATALDHLERVLIEVSNEPGGLSKARLDELQKEMNTDGLLFEVRVLRSRVQGDVEGKGTGATTTKGVYL
ncbi:MAG TPA: hypothetical protein VL495_03540 [Edaphobacter sp.]|jgi:hypothetical protein|nr:hypothetical protein [Edaphobacter sp.]